MQTEKALVVVTRQIPQVGIRLLEEYFTVRVNTKSRPLTPSELVKFVVGAKGILTLLTDKIDSGVLKSAGKGLKIIANFAVGFDNIDLVAAKKQKVIITNTPNVLTSSVAEHTFALMISVARRIVESDVFARTGKYKGWEPELLLGQELFGKTLGILGLGRIGMRVAEIATSGFGMKVIYYDQGKRHRELDNKIHCEAVTIRKLLTSSDFISLHVPLNRHTRHLIGKTEFVSMKENAILINTSRGPVIDEKALVVALKKKMIWGAGLDVFEFEPDITADLKKLSNIILTPHTASATLEARSAMAELAAKNIIAVLSGDAPLTPVKQK